MLVKATKENIEQYMDFAYALAMDPTKSGYPLWSDGIATKKEFVDRVWESYACENRDILLFVADGAVEGWIQFFYIEESGYLQTDGFLINRHTERAITEFLAYAGAHFTGYDLYLGFPKRNTAAIAALQKRNCRLLEECYHDIYRLDGTAIHAETEGIARVTENNFSEYGEIFSLGYPKRLSRILCKPQKWCKIENHNGGKNNGQKESYTRRGSA